MKKLKLFVWDGALGDWSGGIMFALAPDVETARKMLLDELGDTDAVVADLKIEPEIFTKPVAFGVYGGG